MQELNLIMGTIIVFNKIASTHLCEILLRGTTVETIDERSAEILMASFNSELVNPCVLFETISLIVVNQCSEAGSLKDRTVSFENICVTLSFIWMACCSSFEL